VGWIKNKFLKKIIKPTPPETAGFLVSIMEKKFCVIENFRKPLSESCTKCPAIGCLGIIEKKKARPSLNLNDVPKDVWLILLARTTSVHNGRKDGGFTVRKESINEYLRINGVEHNVTINELINYFCNLFGYKIKIDKNQLIVFKSKDGKTK